MVRVEMLSRTNISMLTDFWCCLMIRKKTSPDDPLNSITLIASASDFRKIRLPQPSSLTWCTDRVSGRVHAPNLHSFFAILTRVSLGVFDPVLRGTPEMSPLPAMWWRGRCWTFRSPKEWGLNKAQDEHFTTGHTAWWSALWDWTVCDGSHA